MGVGLPEIRVSGGNKMICFTDLDYEIIVDSLESYKHKKGKPHDNTRVEGVIKRIRCMTNIRDAKRRGETNG